MGILHEARHLGKESRQGWNEPAVLMLNEAGMIRDCNKASEALFGFNLRDLMLLHVSGLLPQLAGIALTENEQVNPALVHLCQCGHVFWAQNRDGDRFPSELGIVRAMQAGGLLRLFVMQSEGPFQAIQ